MIAMHRTRNPHARKC